VLAGAPVLAARERAVVPVQAPVAQVPERAQELAVRARAPVPARAVAE